MTAPPLMRSLGGWMAVAGGALMIVNAARAFNDPVAFATYLGLPLAAPQDAVLIHVYGLRALFIGIVVIGLLIARQRLALAVVAAAAVIMPVGDALLTHEAGAAMPTVLRHVGIAAFLAVAAVALAWPLQSASK